MGFDKRGNMRLHCMTKKCDCEEYDAPKEGHNCGFCDCKPTKHRVKGEHYIAESGDNDDSFDDTFLCIEEDPQKLTFLQHEDEVIRKLMEGARMLEEEDLQIFGATNKYGIFEDNDHIFFSCSACGVKLFMARSKREAKLIGLKNLNIHRDSVGHRFNISVAVGTGGDICTSTVGTQSCNSSEHNRKHVYEIATIFEKNAASGM